MKALIAGVAAAILLSACNSMSSLYLPNAAYESDEAIAKRRAAIRAMDQEDYQDERAQRKDAIEDLGTMQMNAAKAVNKAYENRSKQKIYIIR